MHFIDFFLVLKTTEDHPCQCVQIFTTVFLKNVHIKSKVAVDRRKCLIKLSLLGNNKLISGRWVY